MTRSSLTTLAVAGMTAATLACGATAAYAGNPPTTPSAHFRVTNLQYGLNPANPAQISSLSFRAVPAITKPNRDRVTIVATQTFGPAHIYRCSADSKGRAVICKTTALRVDLLKTVADSA